MPSEPDPDLIFIDEARVLMRLSRSSLYRRIRQPGHVFRFSYNGRITWDRVGLEMVKQSLKSEPAVAVPACSSPGRAAASCGRPAPSATGVARSAFAKVLAFAPTARGGRSSVPSTGSTRRSAGGSRTTAPR